MCDCETMHTTDVFNFVETWRKCVFNKKIS